MPAAPTNTISLPTLDQYSARAITNVGDGVLLHEPWYDGVKDTARITEDHGRYVVYPMWSSGDHETFTIDLDETVLFFVSDDDTPGLVWVRIVDGAITEGGHTEAFVVCEVTS